MNIPELSLCFNPDQNPSVLLKALRSSSDPLLNKMALDIRSILWQDYKEELISMALYNTGSDVSQVGFPVTEDLLSMNALAPIPTPIIARIGGEKAFHPTVLKIAKRHQEGRIWALPWLIDPRAIFYWKDMTDAVGASPDKDFASAEGMEDACHRMKTKGIEYPWVLGMADRFVMIHSITSWIWGKGGDFISPDGKRAVFLDDTSLNGMDAFFRLAEFMPPENYSFNAPTAHRFFTQRKAAITIGPYGCLDGFRAAIPPEMRDRLGVALPPGPPLLAGSDLVLWKHSRKEQQVSDLFYALFNTEVQIKYAEYAGDLPVTIKALQHLSNSGDSNVNVFIETLNSGRLFATTKFAGMLETQLSTGLTGLWARLCQDPVSPSNRKETIKTTLEPVRRRFDMLHETHK